MLATYKVSDVDIDTSCEKVVGLSHLAIPACLPQLHLLESRGSMIKVGKTSHTVSSTCSVQYLDQDFGGHAGRVDSAKNSKSVLLL